MTRHLGTLAATVQSGAAPIAARSAFAVCQSAGAAGYGLAIVNGIAQGAIAAGTALKLCFGWLNGSGNAAEDAVESTLRNADDGGAGEKNVDKVKEG